LRRAVLLALLLTLAACRNPGTPVKPSRTPAPRATSVTSIKSVSPQPSATVAATPTPGAAPRLLQPPSEAFNSLTGKVKLDAVAAGGSLLSDQGSAFTTPIGGALLSDHGSGIVSDHGAALVTAGGTIVANNSGNIIPADGDRGGPAAVGAGGALLASGGLLSDSGGSIVANNSGNLVSNNAGSLTGKTKYRLQEVEDRPPTAGMLVSAVSLKTHQYVPVGVDPDGKPVYTVYSNLKGEYQLYLPQSEDGNVLIVASSPEQAQQNLVANALTPTAAKEVPPIDEDVALATRNVRRVFVSRMAALLTGNQGAESIASVDFKTGLGPLIDHLVAVASARAKADGVPQGPGTEAIPEVQELAQLITDAALARIDLPGVQTSKLLTPKWDGPDEPAYKALGQSYGVIRERTAAYMKAKPNAKLVFSLDERTSTEADLPGCYHRTELELKTDSDVGTYIQEQILQHNFLHSFGNANAVLFALATTPIGQEALANASDPSAYFVPELGQYRTLTDRIDACQLATLGAILLTLSPPDWDGAEPYPPGAQLVVDLIDGYSRAHSFSAAPAPTPRLTCD
jgi:hypothetical protein